MTRWRLVTISPRWGEIYGIAAVQPAASKSPPDSCSSFFESPRGNKEKPRRGGRGFFFIGDPLETRTPDPLLKRQLLYRLS